MRYVYAIALIFSVLLSYGQAVTKASDLGSKDKKKFKKALELQSCAEYDKSVKIFDKLLVKYPDFLEARARKAAIAYAQKDYDLSIAEFERCLALTSGKSEAKLQLSLATAARSAQQFNKAVSAYDRYLELTSPESKSYRIAKRHRDNSEFSATAVKNPLPFVPIKLSEAVNSPNLEYLPVFVADGSKMIFTRRIGGQEDFYEADIINDTIRTARSMDALNTVQNEGAHTISADGRHLIFTVCDHRRTIGSCDLYQSRQQKEGWTTPASMGSFINSITWDAQPCLSENGATLVFASKRPGGFGGSDIWITQKDIAGRWNAPKNIDPIINNSGNQESPYLHPDGKTLYFRSDGHPGMGKFDIFMSRKQPDGSWSLPQNLGYPVNTTGDEGGLFVSLDGSEAYFATDSGAHEDDSDYNLDLFKFELPESIRPYPSSYIKMTATDAKSAEPITALVTIYDEDQKIWNHGNTLPDEPMVTTLAKNQKYFIIVESDGYESSELEVSLDSIRIATDAYEYVIALRKSQEKETLVEETNEKINLPQKGQAIVLEHMLFAKSSATLEPSSMNQIAELKNLLVDNPDIKIKIIGHTSSEGPDDLNQILSEERAQSVYKALISSGISSSRLAYEGKGESQPIAPNISALGREKNRRTEFIIL